MPGVTEQHQVCPSMPPSITLESELQGCKHFKDRDDKPSHSICSALRWCLSHEKM